MASSTEQADRIKKIWPEHLEVAKTLAQHADAVSNAVDMIYSSLAAGGQSLVGGGGESAADVQQLAGELSGRLRRERQPFRAQTLHANTSSLTAIGNDNGYEFMFARELSAHARPGDVFRAITTTGKSPNILSVIEAAHKSKVTVIGLTAESGGMMRSACDLCLCIPSKPAARIQETQSSVGHAMCEPLEEQLTAVRVPISPKWNKPA